MQYTVEHMRRLSDVASKEELMKSLDKIPGLELIKDKLDKCYEMEEKGTLRVSHNNLIYYARKPLEVKEL